MVRSSRSFKEREVQQYQEKEDWDFSWRALSWTPIWVPWIHGVLSRTQVRIRAQLQDVLRLLRWVHDEAQLRPKSVWLHLEVEQTVKGQGGPQEQYDERYQKVAQKGRRCKRCRRAHRPRLWSYSDEGRSWQRRPGYGCWLAGKSCLSCREQVDKQRKSRLWIQEERSVDAQ